MSDKVKLYVNGYTEIFPYLLLNLRYKTNNEDYYLTLSNIVSLYSVRELNTVTMYLNNCNV